MAIINISGAGEIGIIRDRQPHELPLNAWDDGQNVRFLNGYVEKTRGYLASFGTPSVAPYGLFPFQSNTKYNWIYAGLGKVYVYDGSLHTNITRQNSGVDDDYNGTATNKWTGGVLGGIPILNNGVDAPQMWLPANTGVRLQELLNWPGNTTCEVMRVYKQYLLALNVVKSGVRYPLMLKWSHPADPQNVPSSWSETDTTKDAGEYTFGDTTDLIVDCLPLRDSNIVYKESSTWAMQHIGGINIFRFSKLFGTFGMLAPNCAIEFITGQHLVLTQGDVVVHDGLRAESILNEKWLRWLSRNINSDAATTSFLTADYLRREVWICIPTNGSSLPNRAIIWNWKTGAIGIRNLPEASIAVSGIVSEDTTDTSWAAATLTWAEAEAAWGEKLYTEFKPSILMASPGNVKLYKADADTGIDVGVQSSYVTRTGLGVPFKQESPPDFTSVKFLRNVWPRIEGTAGGIVSVEVGFQNEINGAVTWQPAKNYVIGQTRKIDCIVSGRLFAFRFSSEASVLWRLHGYELDVDFGGDY